MTTLDQQIMEKVQQLDDTQKQQVLTYLDNELLSASEGNWLEQARALRQSILEDREQNQQNGEEFSVQALLDEVREERLNDIMGGR